MSQERFFENFMLGVTTGHIPIDDRTLNVAAIHKLVSSATLNLHVISRSLDRSIYDRADIVDEISKFVRRSRNANVKILVFDNTNIIKNGHRLVSLANRISSKIIIRQLPDDFKDCNESMVIADQFGFLHNQKSDRYEGMVSFNDSQRCSELNKMFIDFWDRSVIDNELRQLSI